jgi:cytoskeleton protein RodZ
MTETSPSNPSSAGVGQQLSALRQKKGLSIHDVSTRLRFSTRQLAALEEGQYDALPDMTFVRAMIRTYARFLESDPAPLIAALEAERPDAVPRLMVVQPVSVPSQGVAFFREVREGNRRWIVAALLLLVLALIGAWVWHIDDVSTGAGGAQQEAPQPAVPAGAAVPAPAPTVNHPPEP